MRDHNRTHHHEERERHHHRHERHAHREWRGERERHRGRGPGGRVRRGESRYLLLDALSDGPKHGYEIIKALEERSAGQYAPSAGTVYPTLQYLEDTGWVSSQQETERRVYQLTETGRAELDAHREEIDAFWAQVKGPTISDASQAEIGFIEEELHHLAVTIEQGLQSALVRDDHETIRRIRQAVEQCRNAVRGLITDTTSEGKK